ncbi:methyltransferase [Candidatus Altiarchaeota archaeon]
MHSVVQPPLGWDPVGNIPLKPVDVERIGIYFDKGLIKVLGDEVRPGMQVADMGAAKGQRALLLAGKGAFVDSIEIDADSLKVAGERVSEAPKDMAARITLVESDLFNNPSLKGKRYDIISFNPPLMNDRPLPADGDYIRIAYDIDFKLLQRFLAESRDRLKPDGRIIMGYGYDDLVDKTGHIERGGIQTLKKHAENDYEIKLVMGEKGLYYGIYKLTLKQEK